MSERVAIKTSIGGLSFDATLQTDHTSSLTITEHPVEIGAAVADHAYVNPNEVTIEIGMSDAAVMQGGQFGGSSRSVTAYEALRDLQAQREPFTVLTRLKQYQNMLIESIGSPDDFTTTYGLRATVSLKEILVVSTQTVKVSARPHKTGQTNSGVQQPIEANRSIAKEFDALTGGKINALLGG